ncbi:hypothetical protein SBV1_30038 [Verrucomicrobia bacterium]|nr:hypothetical protein SBV1_30038 [Verrucomicrobiota bacterium]
MQQPAAALTCKWQLWQRTKQKVENLEALGRQRTSDLSAANEKLHAEMAARSPAERVRQAMEVQLPQAQKLEVLG